MATSPSSRPRRLPRPDFADEPAAETIEAFFSRPKQQRGRPADPPLPLSRQTDPLMALDDRLTWNDALRRESDRNRRYRRPAAVAVIAADARGIARHADGWLARLAGPIAHAIRRGARETDHVARAGEASFQVLLPETTEDAARRFAERVIADCEVWLGSIGAPIAVRAAVVGTSPTITLEEALARAVREIEAPDR